MVRPAAASTKRAGGCHGVCGTISAAVSWPARNMMVSASNSRRLRAASTRLARNTICAYSLRGKEKPWVATPVTWDEVGAADSPDALRFLPEDVLARVAESGDLFADVLADDGPPVPRVESGVDA